MPPSSPRQLLPAAVSSPLFHVRAASQADQQCSVADSHRGSRCAARWERSALLQRRRRRRASCGCELAALSSAALALAAAAMIARHESVGGREGGSRSDRSGAVRRGRYERGARLRLCLAPVPCVSSHDAREGTALSGSPSPGRMPSTCGPNPEVPWRRRQHQCARPTQLVALPICRVCRCVCTAAPHAARTPQGAPARRLVNLVGFAFSVPKTTLTYRTNLC